MKPISLTEQQQLALKTTLYILGAGAFGLFARWMQHMLAFDDNGLVDASVWNFFVPIVAIIVGVIFRHFNKLTAEDGYTLPDSYVGAFSWTNPLIAILIYAAGIIMFLGALILYFTCSTETQATLLRILAVFGAVCAISFPLSLRLANSPDSSARLRCILGTIPVVFFCFWLIVIYKINAINSVIWEFAVEIIAVCFAIVGFFRISGFAFGVPASDKAIFYSRFVPFAFLVCIADSRNIGMQIILFAAALMLGLYNWIMTCNLQLTDKPKKAYETAEDDGGFEKL